MNKLIEKYVYDVTRRLPLNQREDVAEELKANILEMIENENNDEEVKQVLYSLGSPRKLANNYRTNKQYLISSEWMADYLYVLKIVLIVLGSIGLVFGLIEALQTHESTDVFGIFFEVFGKTLGNIFDALLSGFAIVTIIFYLIDNYGEKKDNWKIEDLPEPPKKASLKISRAGSISGLIFTIIFGVVWLYVLYYSNIYFGWFNVEGTWVVEQSLFNLEYTRSFVLLFGVSIIIEIIVYLFKIQFTHWNKTLAILYSLSKIVSAIVAIIFLLGVNLINADFILKASAELSYSVSDIENFIKIFKYSLAGIIIFANVVDLITNYFKQFRYIE